MVAGIKRLFDQYDEGRLEGVWQRTPTKCNRVLRVLGWNNFEVQHGGAEQRQNKGHVPHQGVYE